MEKGLFFLLMIQGENMSKDFLEVAAMCPELASYIEPSSSD
jgi:hypothetical protein